MVPSTDFRPNLSTHDGLWLLHRVFSRIPGAGNPDYVLVIDMRKAFDRVSQAAILEELSRAFPSQRAQNWVRNFFDNRAPFALAAPTWDRAIDL